jgi:hypothetical protein
LEAGAVKIDVRADIEAARARLRYHLRPAIPKAAAAALNRVGTHANSLAVKELAEVTGLKQKDVREALSRTRATWANLQTKIAAIGRALNLIRFGARQTKRGVTASAWGRRRLYAGTFIANKGRTVFKRAKVGDKRAGRLPIAPVHGPSIPREFGRKALTGKLEAAVLTRWRVEFAAQLKYYIGKL